MSRRNLARKGPQKVWRGYRNLRVPDELFDDVRNYLERRKQEYLLIKQGSLPDREKELLLGPDNANSSLIDMIREVIHEELSGKSSSSRIRTSNEFGLEKEILPYLNKKLTSKEQVLELLKAKPNVELTTTEIQEILNLPSATARQAARELSEEMTNIKKIPGRPNKFLYEN